MNTHIQLNNPQKGDEEQIERHEETEGAADIRDGLALCRRDKHVRGREGHRRRVGSIQGSDGRQAAPELTILSAWHSWGETGNSPCNRRGETESEGHAGYSHWSFNINQNLEWAHLVRSTNRCWCPVQCPTAESERKRENRKRAISIIVTLSVNVLQKTGKEEAEREILH